jgi:uncharacterized delta-60 repeat protein
MQRAKAGVAGLAAALLAVAAAPAAAAPGDLDPTFSVDGWDTPSISMTDYAEDVAIQPDGKIVAIGRRRNPSPSPSEFSVVRYLRDGTLDSGFGTAGKVGVSFATGSPGGTNVDPAAVAIQPDGKIVVVGSTDLSTDGTSYSVFNFAIVRLNANGLLDPTFNANGIAGTRNDNGRLIRSVFDKGDRAADVLIAAGGRILVAGTSVFPGDENPADVVVLALTASGEPDTSFGSGGTAYPAAAPTMNRAEAMTVQPDGKVIVVGVRKVGAQYDFGLWRWTAAGAADASFGTSGARAFDAGRAWDAAAGVVVQPGGAFVVAGSDETGASPGGDANYTLARFNAADGSTDASFGTGGVARVPINDSGFLNDLAQDPAGRLVVTGFAGAGTPDLTVGQVSANGVPDAGFGNVVGGIARIDLGGIERAHAVAIQPDGAIVLAGTEGKNSGERTLVARLVGSPLPIAGGSAPAAGGGGGGGAGAGAGGGGGPGPAADLLAPTVESLAMARSFRAAASGDSVGAAAAVGTRVTYTLSEPATATFTVERRAAGRSAGSRCVKPTGKNRKRGRCVRWLPVKGSFTHAGNGGPNAFTFTGRIGGKKLRPGPYQLVLVAVDAAGNRSAPKLATFKIVKR